MTASFGGICAIIAILGCFYLLLAIGIVLLWRRFQAPLVLERPEPVTILKPLHGAEPRLGDCLRSFCEQDYPAPIQIVFGVRDRNDGALAAANAIKAAFADLTVSIVVDPAQYGTNAKISNLINMDTEARHDIVVAADSDMLVKPDHIRNTVALLQKPGVGAVSVLYRGESAAGFWSRLSALCINAHFLPNVLVGKALGLARPCFGSTIALRRETLTAIGGFEAFANQLADDYAIGEAVRGAGLSVEIGSFATAHMCGEQNATELMNHQLRWARTIRNIDPPGYLGSFMTHPFAIALLGVASGNRTCIAVAAAALGLRIILMKAVERVFEAEAAPIGLAPIVDLMSFSVYVRSFFGSAVTWKRAQFNVLRNGTLVQNRQG